MTKINIAIVDDHSLFRHGLKEMFQSIDDFSISFEAENGEDLLQKLVHSQPDVILLDLKMPKMGGMACLKFLSSKYPKIKVLILSMFDDNPFIVKAIKLGARGYLLKNAEPEELYKAVKTVYQQDYYINEKLSISLIKGITEKQRIPNLLFELDPLSNMEKEILKNVCLGLTNQQIAEKMFKSLRTIEGYRHRLLEKTQSNNTATLVAWAFRTGLVQ